MSASSGSGERGDGELIPRNGDEEGDLDPDDWEQFLHVGRGLLDDLVEHVRTVRERPVWTAPPPEVIERLEGPPPEHPTDIDVVLDEVRHLVLPYALGNLHPRFWGWVHGAATPVGIFADAVAAAMNANVGGRNHAPVYVERQVVDWFRRILGFPEGTSGILVSGTSMATLIGLAVAREVATGFESRKRGVAGERLTAYVSEEGHVSVRRALEILGLGSESLRHVPTGSDRRIDVAALERALVEDSRRGERPFCVIGCAGSVLTGAIDDLEALAEVCGAHGAWLHVDGAFGAMLALSPSLRDRVRGIERADSVAFDFHKWLQVPYDAGCVLVRDAEAHRRTFECRQDYLQREASGLAAGEPWFCDFGPELSRGFRALKVWMTVRRYGTRRLGRVVERNCEQAALLGRLIDAEPGLERVAPVSLNVVCFRCAAAEGRVGDDLDRRVVRRLQETGVAVPSTVRIDGRTAIRTCIVNHRTTDADVRQFVRDTARTCRECAAELGPAGEGT